MTSVGPHQTETPASAARRDDPALRGWLESADRARRAAERASRDSAPTSSSIAPGLSSGLSSGLTSGRLAREPRRAAIKADADDLATLVAYLDGPSAPAQAPQAGPRADLAADGGRFALDPARAETLRRVAASYGCAPEVVLETALDWYLSAVDAPDAAESAETAHRRSAV